MAISTSATSTKLTGEDARKFNNQVKFGRPSNAARDSYARGSKLLKSLQKNGAVKVTSR